MQPKPTTLGTMDPFDPDVLYHTVTRISYHTRMVCFLHADTSLNFKYSKTIISISQSMKACPH